MIPNTIMSLNTLPNELFCLIVEYVTNIYDVLNILQVYKNDSDKIQLIKDSIKHVTFSQREDLHLSYNEFVTLRKELDTYFNQTSSCQVSTEEVLEVSEYKQTKYKYNLYLNYDVDRNKYDSKYKKECENKTFGIDGVWTQSETYNRVYKLYYENMVSIVSDINLINYDIKFNHINSTYTPPFLRQCVYENLQRRCSHFRNGYKVKFQIFESILNYKDETFIDAGISRRLVKYLTNVPITTVVGNIWHLSTLPIKNIAPTFNWDNFSFIQILDVNIQYNQCELSNINGTIERIFFNEDIDKHEYHNYIRGNLYVLYESDDAYVNLDIIQYALDKDCNFKDEDLLVNYDDGESIQLKRRVYPNIIQFDTPLPLPYLKHFILSFPNVTSWTVVSNISEPDTRLYVNSSCSVSVINLCGDDYTISDKGTLWKLSEE